MSTLINRCRKTMLQIVFLRQPSIEEKLQTSIVVISLRYVVLVNRGHFLTREIVFDFETILPLPY